MLTADLDTIERDALAYIVGELETGKTHVLTDTFLPFLKSLGAGHRLVAILKYFEALELLTPQTPPGNRWEVHPLRHIVIPAYWRIEGKAVILHRALQEKELREPKNPKEGQRGRGRPRDTDPQVDQRIWDAWKSGEHKTYDDLARLLGTSAREVELAIDRHRRRLERDSAQRRTNSPDK
jgi:hypothetical protein